MTKKILLLISQLVLALLILTCSLSLWNVDWDIPFDFNGDTIWFATLIQNMVETGWVYQVPRLMAPFTLQAVAFPSLSNFDWLVMKVISFFVHSGGEILNLFWFISIIITMWSATFSFILINVRWKLSLMFGMVYAFLPYTFLRNVYHISLVYYTVPLLCVICIWVAQGCKGQNARLIQTCGVVICLVQGFNFIYFSFFTLVLLLFAALYAFLNQRSCFPLKKALVFGFIILVSSSVNLLPSFINWQIYGTPPKTAVRVPYEAELYALKLRKMLAPSATDKIPLLHSWGKRDVKANFPNENENKSARLGPLGAIGLIFLLGVSLRLVRLRGEGGDEAIQSIAALNLFLLIFATVGGLGAVLNLWFPTFRTYNRFSVYIAFLSLSALALWSQGVYTRIKSSKKRNFILCFTFVIFSFSMYDQTQDARFLRVEKPDEEARFNHLRDILLKIEARVPWGTRVFQLPITPFPADGGVERILPYEQGYPYLASSSLRWSWPSFSVRHSAWLERVQKLQGSSYVDALVLSGFGLIWVDRFGYADNGEHVIHDLIAGGATYFQGVDDSRYVLLDIGSVRDHLIQDKGLDEFQKKQKAILVIPMR